VVFFREHYLTAVTWASDTQLSITYLNRKAVQNYRTDLKEKRREEYCRKQ
jgi:hypothetical protein